MCSLASHVDHIVTDFNFLQEPRNVPERCLFLLENATSVDNFYGPLGGRDLLETVKAELRSEYDYILIDRRNLTKILTDGQLAKMDPLSEEVRQKVLQKFQ